MGSSFFKFDYHIGTIPVKTINNRKSRKTSSAELPEFLLLTNNNFLPQMPLKSKHTQSSSLRIPQLSKLVGFETFDIRNHYIS